MTNLILIAAVARNRVIGRGSRLVWRNREDMERFRLLTMGHAVLMGRKTWESLPESFLPLPGRLNLVLSRTPFETSSTNMIVVSSLEQALEVAASHGHSTLYVIGGGEVYRATIDHATRLELTEIETDLEGDVFFPVLDATWHVHARAHREGFAFTTYTKGERTPHAIPHH